jgi:uncharacterized membrane protein YecN with MAPEG domain
MIKFVPISAAYAGILALLFLALCFQVIKLRRQFSVGIGDGGQEPLICAIRAQANFNEYVPYCILLLVLLELNGATAVVIHALGSALVVARALHAWGLSHSPHRSFGRYYGTLVTWIVLLAGAVLNLYVGFS